ncbi:MAG TPA: hypothetical protein VFU05_14710 [Cyclobacteriaceae bacterium]|nr:hypothetical protein [Cyclobacteriaceae bacterium]
MEVPNPPFYSITDELLYNIYLKLQGGLSLTGNDINTLAKLNAFLQDTDLMSSEQVIESISALKGNVPAAANSLEKLYNIVQGITSLKREDIDTIAELNAILTDADLVRISDLADTLVALNLKQRTVQFYFASDHWSDNQNQYQNRDRFVLRGKINSLAEDFTNELSGASYKARLDTSSSWVSHSNLVSLQTWINSNITGNEYTGTKYWIRCLPVYKSGHDGEAMNVLTYHIA